MIECAIIRDLLPLYVDDVLSKESSALVTEHLATCESCKNEFINMQSEIKKLPLDNGAKIDVLKAMKKKIFKQKVIVAMIASVVAISVAIGGFWFIFHNDKPIEYTEGIIHVEKSTTEMSFNYDVYNDDVVTVPTNVLNIYLSSPRKYYSSYTTSRQISVNGVETEIVYFYLSETLSAKWWSNIMGDQTIHFASISEKHSFSIGSVINDLSLPMEIYYLVMPRFDKMFPISDEDYYALRSNGVLLWSGTLE